MKFIDFKNKYKTYPYFYSSQLVSNAEPLPSIRKQLNDWGKKGLIMKLKKGLYTLNDMERQLPLNRELVSNILVEPSYVSLEYALSIYGLIPEQVKVVTGITPKKTASFTNKIGVFLYKHVKQQAYFGYQEATTSQQLIYYIATPEKAFLDLMYFNLSRFNGINEFLESYRIQNTQQLNTVQLREFANLFKSKKLQQWVNHFFKSNFESDYQEL